MSFLLPALVCLNPQKLSIDFQKICEILAFLLFPFLLSTFISDLCDNWIRDETCHLLGYYYAASSGNCLALRHNPKQRSSDAEIANIKWCQRLIN